ncbi:hypothetical protein BK004_02600 [bacterium CG10_46_32]|nr:MAG: hypothetical protein BK004_02600 [bacterium CG10_46_32]PIR56091.1 MAG: hypothetical protein COU73_02625 [Parcubacteria group bacterium CG10_big_fil_rev_8_21_14_0_10_46_32]
MQNIKQNVLEYLLIGATVLVLGIILFVAVWRFGVSEDFMPLHYTIYFGFNRFGPKYDLFLFPTLGGVLFAVNVVVSNIVFLRNKLWHALFLGLTFVMEVMLLVSLVLAVLKGLS